jgi:hypothetical protein
MPDISMCKGVNCKQASECYRHIATPNPDWQAWAMFDDAARNARGECEYFIEARSKSQLHRLNEQTK